MEASELRTGRFIGVQRLSNMIRWAMACHLYTEHGCSHLAEQIRPLYAHLQQGSYSACVAKRYSCTVSPCMSSATVLIESTHRRFAPPSINRSVLCLPFHHYLPCLTNLSSHDFFI